jgi:hypothetical protein
MLFLNRLGIIPARRVPNGSRRYEFGARFPGRAARSVLRHGHQPGPFSLGDPEVLTRLLEDAGFKDVVVKRLNAPVRVKTSAECLRFEKESFGAL